MTPGETARSQPGFRRLLPQLAALSPLLLVLVPLLRGRIWFHGDLEFYFYGLRGLLRDAWVHGLPGWTPFVSCGMPLLGDIQLAPFYPPNILFYFLKPGTAFNIYFAAHFALGTYLAWRYLRRHGHSPWPSAFGTLVFLWGGFFWVHLHHPTFLGAGIWLPALLEAWDDVADRRHGILRGMVTLALVTAMAALAGGSPQILYYELLVSLAYALFLFRDRSARGDPSPRARARFVALGVVAIFLGLGVAAIQFVPGFFAAAERYPAILPPVDYASEFSLSLLALPRLLVPNVFGDDFYEFAGHGYQGPSTYWESWVYFGVLTIPLMIVAMGRRGRQGFFTALFGFACLASLGKIGGLHYLLAWLLPLYTRFRAPSRWIMVASFAAAVLSATGLEQLIQAFGKDSQKRRERGQVGGGEPEGPPSSSPRGSALPDVSRVALVTLVIGVELWALCAFIIFWRDVPLHPVAIVGWVLGLCNVIAAWAYLNWVSRMQVSPHQRRHLLVGAPAVGLLLIDLFPILVTYDHTVPGAVAQETPTLVSVLLDRSGHGRVLVDRSGPLYLLNGGNEFGYRGVRGYNPLNPARLERLLEAADGSKPRQGGITLLVNNVTSPLLDLTADRLLVTGKARIAPWLVEVYRDVSRRVRVYENLRALPRAFLSDRVVYASDSKKALEFSRLTLDRRAREADRTCHKADAAGRRDCFRSLPSPPVVLEGAGPRLVAPTPGAARGSSLRWVTDRPDEIVLDVQAIAPVFLVLADTFAPGWTATVDGDDVPIQTAYHAFRAVMIPVSGRHRVRFYYRAPGFAAGVWITVLCLGGVGAAWIRSRTTGRVWA